MWIVIASLQELLSPYLIKYMIDWISKEDFKWQDGFGYAVALGVIASIKIYGFRRATYLVTYNQVYTYSIINYMVMNKSLKLTSSSLGIVEIGSITALLAGDALQLSNFNFFINTLITVPVLVIAITAILVIEFGLICLVTPVVFVVLIWIQYKGSSWCLNNVFGQRAKYYD